MSEQKQQHILIDAQYIGWRYDVALAELMPDYSRAKISSWIKEGKAKLNGVCISGNKRIKQAGTVDIYIENNPKQNWQADAIHLDIIYEDDDILVINKPAGLISHPGAGNSSNTLANALLYHNPKLSQLDRAGIVHRLDKDTSGLLVVAKNAYAQQSLIKQLQTRQVKREYLAICNGRLIAGDTIDAPIGRHPKNRTKQAVNLKSGKAAITHYRVLERFKNYTFVKVILESGRTHQIRVHFQHIGHSLVADKTYGHSFCPKAISDELKHAIKEIQRHCLHAKKITLIHPETKKVRAWQAKLPDDMTAFLNQLKQYDVLTDGLC